MNLSSALLLLLVSSSGAFSPITPQHSLQATPAVSSSRLFSETQSKAPLANLFQDKMQMDYLTGGKTIRTYQMTDDVERVQYVLRTNGRPLKAMVQLWCGPRRNTHTLEIDSEDGNTTPYRGILRFKPGQGMGQVLKIQTNAGEEFPLEVGVEIPSHERAEELKANTELIYKTAKLAKIQGGDVRGGRGAIRSWPIPDDVSQIQFVAWSKNTGSKSFKCRIELIQGPNQVKQKFDLQCGGGSQPYHAIYQTPGSGWTLRMFNKKFVEDGLFEVAIMPYPAKSFETFPSYENNPTSRAPRKPMGYESRSATGKQWWE